MITSLFKQEICFLNISKILFECIKIIWLKRSIILFKLLKNLKLKDVFLFLLVVVLIFAQVALELQLPKYMTQIVNGITAEDVSQILSTQEILSLGLNMILISLGSVVCSIIVGYIVARIGAGFSRNVRSKFFKKIESFSMQDMSSFSTSSLITRTTNDISQVQSLITMGIRILITAPLMGIWSIIEIVKVSASMSVATAIAIFVLVSLIVTIFVIAIPKFKKIQTLTDKTNLVTRENLTGLRVVRAYNSEQFQEERFAEVNSDLTKTNLFVSRIMALLSPVMILILSGLTLFIYWFGSSLVSKQLLNIGQLMAFAQYSMMILSSFSMLTMVFIMFPRASVSAKRINAVLDTKNVIEYPVQTLNKTELSGEVEFRNVSFKYPDAEDCVLKNISFVAKKGQTVAFIGSTGSGKSTLINLVPRFYDVTEGEVLVDGVDVRNYDKNELVNKIGYVPQRGMLFRGTIMSNIRYGKEDATEEEVKKACSIAQASNFISKFKDGYNHEIAQGGSNVSGGQRQRLSIARAIVKNPEIFIFDDSFSALDYKTDKKLRKALKKEVGEATKLIVAQRVGTIIDADLIIVLENGEMVGSGTHEQLLKSCEVYREIASSQLSKEEI